MGNEEKKERLAELKELATEMGIDFPHNIGLEKLEAKVQKKLDEAETEPETIEPKDPIQEDQEIEQNDTEITEDEAIETDNEETDENAETIEDEDEADDDAPKLNKDGFEAGKPLSEDELAQYLAKQRRK